MVNVIYLPAMFIFHMEIKRLLKRLLKCLFECNTWVCRLSFYLIIYLVVLSISYLVFLSTNFSHTDVDSARYMLSALIQSEAAIIAIVITMSLVAAQLAASLYSVRVTNIFRNSPDLWILMLIYGIVLFWGLGVLKLIEKADPQCASNLICQSNLQGHIALTYSLGIFAFIALAPYMWNIFGMLNASTITTNCAKNITKESILKSITTKNPADNDYFLTIIDIMKSSLIKYDYGTLETGLSAIEECICGILEDEYHDANEDEKISKYVFGHLAPVGKLALSRADEISTNQVINTMQNIGNIAVKNHCGQMANSAIEYLANIGLSATTRKFELSARMTINAIQEIVTTSVENKIDVPMIATETGISLLGEIGRRAIDNKLEGTTRDVALSLEIIGQIAAINNRSNIILFVINTLCNMSNYAMVKGLPNLCKDISNFLDIVYTSIPAEMKLEKKEAFKAIKMLKAFRLTSYKNS